MQKIKEEMLQGKEVFLLDGFPRDLEQDKSFREAMEAEFWVRSSLVLPRCYLTAVVYNEC